MPTFGQALKLLKIPVQGFVPEQTSTAPTTPAAGQIYTDTTVANAAMPRVYTGSTNGWQPIIVYAGTTSTTYAAGNDTRITGALQAANNLSDLANASTARTNLGLGTAAVANIGTGAGQVAAGNDSRIVNAEQTTNKNAVSGYAGLDGSARIAAAQLPTVITAAGITGAVAGSRYAGATASGAPATGTFSTGDFVVDQTGNIWVCTSGGSPGTWLAVFRLGTTATTAAAGNDSRITGALQAANNLSDLANATTARTNLGLGTAATANKVSAGGTGVLDATDASLTNTRTPTDATVTGGSGAGAGVKIAGDTIYAFNLNSSLKDGAAGTSTTRQLGTSATQAFPGNGRIDQLSAPTATVDFNGQRISGLGAPSAASDAVRLSDLQTAQSGIDAKPSVRILLTSNDTLSGLAARDGVTPIAGDRVLAQNQTTPAQNGVYIAAAGAWARATDGINPNSLWFVEEGTANHDTAWWVTNDGAITVGTTALAISQFAGPAGIVGTTNRISVVGTVIDIAATYVGQTSITTLGTITTGTWTGTSIAVANGGTGATTPAAARTALNTPQQGYAATLGALTAGTPLTVTHNLNTQDVIAQVRDASTNEYIYLDVINASTTTLTVTSGVNYGASALRIVVLPVS